MKQNWKEFEIKDFLGVQSSISNPDKRACKSILNFDNREIDGALTSRTGYSRKYGAITTPTNLTSLNILGFENIFVKEQEVTIAVGTATITEDIVIGTAQSKTIMVVYASHSWDGSAWVEGWTWLNECVYTQLYTTPTTLYEKILDFDGNSTVDYYAGWSIVNGTEAAKIIKSSVSSNKVNIEITNNNNSWTGGVLPEDDKDSVILMKNFIPDEYLEGNIDSVVFHKINNGLRIGFGGVEGRLGLAVDFIDTSLNINSIEFGSYSSAELDKINLADGLVVRPYTLISDKAIVDLTETISTGGGLDASTYYFKVVGTINSSDQILLGELTQITISNDKSIEYSIRLRLGDENQKLTDIDLFYSINNEEFYHIINYKVRGDGKAGVLTDDGYLTLDRVLDTEFHGDDNAASPLTSGDLNSIGEWNVLSGTLSSIVDTGGGSSYALELVGGGRTLGEMEYPIENIEPDTEYNLTFYAKMDAQSSLRAFFDVGISQAITITTVYAYHTMVIKAGSGATSLRFRTNLARTLYLDRLSIYRREVLPITDETILGDELTTALGYAPTRNLVKSWDQALVTQGRAYLINAYIDERYENKIFFSGISGFGANMYDVIATTTGYIDLEKFDGNEIVGMEVYSNMDFHVGKRNSVQRIDPISQQTREISLGDGVVSRESLVNVGGILFWASEFGVKGSNGVEVLDSTKSSIYDTYKELNKENIIATRDEHGNAYTFFGSSGAISEGKTYTLTDKGWLVSLFLKPPEKYIIGREGNVWFLNDSVIYAYDKDVITDDDENGAGVNYPILWESEEFDVYKIAELTSKQRFQITNVWALYKGDVSNLKLKVYLDGATVEANITNQTLEASTTLTKGVLRMPLTNSCERFSFKFSSAEINNPVELHSIGIGYKILQIGNKDDGVN